MRLESIQDENGIKHFTTFSLFVILFLSFFNLFFTTNNGGGGLNFFTLSRSKRTKLQKHFLKKKIVTFTNLEKVNKCLKNICL